MLRLEQVSKQFGKIKAVDSITLDLGQETLALLGPSGCGKSTLLRLVAGLEQVDQGRILLDNKNLTLVPPQSRGFGMVFQDYALFPHLNVEKNIAFGLSKKTREERQRRVGELLDLVGLRGYEKRRIHQLSGGEQQRVALARALAPEPPVLLLDEPLSSLDQTLRENLKQELRRILSQLNIMAIYVTHDQSEAFALAHRIAIMRQGKLVQVSAQNELYNHPANPWVARFLGHPNLYSASQLSHLPFIKQDAILRNDLIRLGTGNLEATVQAYQVLGGLHQLWLLVKNWNLSLRWQGFTREVPENVQVGKTIMIDIPQAAWLELPSES
jgi:ABC-type Fe3+/spermidine/putrescine transport system ATPase subunit